MFYDAVEAKAAVQILTLNASFMQWSCKYCNRASEKPNNNLDAAILGLSAFGVMMDLEIRGIEVCIEGMGSQQCIKKIQQPRRAAAKRAAKRALT